LATPSRVCDACDHWIRGRIISDVKGSRHDCGELMAEIFTLHRHLTALPDALAAMAAGRDLTEVLGEGWRDRILIVRGYQ
jgi:hypothetical protein